MAHFLPVFHLVTPVTAGENHNGTGRLRTPKAAPANAGRSLE
jgi:hypothetical protein